MRSVDGEELTGQSGHSIAPLLHTSIAQAHYRKQKNKKSYMVPSRKNNLILRLG